ncbi:TonB-dependent receptor [Phocaeicola vulgatus]|nr:TonB-dependent receptor [Phocaeicola vulgatus]
MESFFGRFNYNFNEKYYFSASIRTDGSSTLPKDNRWGTFWSVGANWRNFTKKSLCRI